MRTVSSRIAAALLLTCAACHTDTATPEQRAPGRAGPAALRDVIGDGVGLDRMVMLTRELSATSEAFQTELGFDVLPGQVFDDGFAVNYLYFDGRPLFEIQSIYDKQLAAERWGDVEVRFLEQRQGGFQIGIAVSDIPRARRHVQGLGLSEQMPLNAPAQAVFEGPQEPFENKSAVILGDDLPASHRHLAPVYFTNYTHVARASGRERRPEDRHPALRATHPNGATRIAAVYLAVDDLEVALSAYRDLGFSDVVRGEHAAWGARAATLDALDADLVLLEPRRADGPVGACLRERGASVVVLGVRISVRDLALAQDIVEHNTGRSLARYDIAGRRGFLVPPDLTSDVLVELVQE